MIALAQPLLFDTGLTLDAAPVELRDYQTAALAQVDVLSGPGARVVLVLPTGGGKTLTAGARIVVELRAGGKVLFLAHRRELITQTYAALLRLGVPEQLLGIVMADGVITHPITKQRVCCTRPLAPIQIASVDTLRHRKLPPGVTLVIADECHRALARSYRTVLDAYPQALSLGLTATPERGDGRGLGDLFQHLVVAATPRGLMDAGHLSEPRVFTHPVKPDLGDVAITAGDYDEKALAAKMDRKELLGNIVAHWRQHLSGVRTLAFAASVEHSRHIVEAFVAEGIPAEHIDGESRDRDTILERFRQGATLVLSNCAVFTEGTDLPWAKGLIEARPTKSWTLCTQIRGRVLRPWEGITPIILDHANNTAEHGLPGDEREFTLETKKKKKSAVSVRECPQCFGANPGTARVCAYCGTPLVKPGDAAREGRALEERDGELVEVKVSPVALKKLPEDLRALRHEIQDLATRVDEHYRHDHGATNGRLKWRFKKARAEMTREELLAVREHLWRTEPWLCDPVEVPLERLFFTVPEVAGVAW